MSNAKLITLVDAIIFVNGGNIKVKIKKTKEEVIISVMDSGVGIIEENLDKIFVLEKRMFQN